MIINAFESIKCSIFLYIFLLKNTSSPKKIITTIIYVTAVSDFIIDVTQNSIEIKLEIKTSRNLNCKNPLNTNSSINGIRNIKGKIFE
jgi:hypothetical protein